MRAESVLPVIGLTAERSRRERGRRTDLNAAIPNEGCFHAPDIRLIDVGADQQSLWSAMFRSMGRFE